PRVLPCITNLGSGALVEGTPGRIAGWGKPMSSGVSGLGRCFWTTFAEPGRWRRRPSLPPLLVRTKCRTCLYGGPHRRRFRPPQLRRICPDRFDRAALRCGHAPDHGRRRAARRSTRNEEITRPTAPRPRTPPSPG